MLLALLAQFGVAPRIVARDNLRLWPSVGTALSMLVSVVLLGLAMRDQPVDTAYAVWTGIGAVGTVILGIVLFNDPANAARLVCVGLIVAGILGLKLTSV